MGILEELVDRGMKQMAINHAKEKGATDEWLSGLDDLESQVVWRVVTLLYGEPEKIENK
jgi:hypothetical protein